MDNIFRASARNGGCFSYAVNCTFRGLLHFYRYTEDGGKEKVADHPLYFLLHDEPNPEMTSCVFRETLMTRLLLWGNAYSQINRFLLV